MSATIQMGHVPRTRGATGAPGEQAYARAVAAEAARLIRSQGRVAIIVPADPRSYPQTASFIAVHYDGSLNRSAHGASVGYPGHSHSRNLAHRWKAAYRAAGFSGAFRPDNYTPGLSRYYAYSRARSRDRCVIEGGFGSHPREGPWLRSRTGIVTCARAIATAVTGRTATAGTTPTPVETRSWFDMASKSDLDDVVKARTAPLASDLGHARDTLTLLRERLNECTRLAEAAASVAFMLARKDAGLPADTQSDMIHVGRIRKGEYGPEEAAERIRGRAAGSDDGE